MPLTTDADRTKKLGASVFAALLASLTVASCGTQPGSSPAPEPSLDESPVAESPAPSESDTPDEREALRDLLPDEIRDAGQIVVATTPTYAPYQYFDEDGKTVLGANADVLHAVGEVLGVEIKFETLTSYGSTLTGVQSGRYDAAVSWDDTAEREESVNIVTYYDEGMVLVGESSLGTDPTNMCGKRIIVGITDSNAERIPELGNQVCDDAGLERPTYLESTNSNASAVRLQSGQADMVPRGPASAATLIEELRGDFAIVSPVYFPEPTGIILDKSMPELAEALQAALQSLYDSGELADIFDEYGLADSLRAEIEINGVGGTPIR